MWISMSQQYFDIYATVAKQQLRLHENIKADKQVYYTGRTDIMNCRNDRCTAATWWTYSKIYVASQCYGGLVV